VKQAVARNGPLQSREALEGLPMPARQWTLAREQYDDKEIRTLIRVLAWICLVATLSGPFLREAESAEDLARSLAELGSGPLVEEVDGGVGYDSGATILAAKQAVTITFELTGFLGELVADARGLRGLVDILSHRFSSLSLLAFPRGPAATPLRFAWLARFLF
jgi:hypothetical protein